MRSPGRDRLVTPLWDRLPSARVSSGGAHYPTPVHRQPGYSGRLACGPSGLGVTGRAAPQILNLPMYPQLCDAAIDRAVAEIRPFLS